MVKFENRDIREIRILKKDFHDWLESKIPSLAPSDNIISIGIDPQHHYNYLIKIEKA